MRNKMFAIALLSGTLVVSIPQVAFANATLDEATQALQSSALYVSPLVGDLSAEAQSTLTSNIGSTDIAIAVLPASARSEISDIPAFIQELASRTGHDTVMVSIGGDLEAGSSALESGVASQLANQAEGAGLTDGLNQFVDNVQAELQSGQPVTDDPGGTDSGILPIIGVGSVVLLIVVAAAGVFAFMRRRPRETRKYALDKGVPSEIREQLNKIWELIEKVDDPAVVENLRNGQKHVSELFKRLRKEQPDKIQQVTAQYRNTLKITYNVVYKYIDYQENPDYVPRDRTAKETLANGKRATQQYVTGVIQNIQEIEAGSFTNFNVDTKILERTVKQDEPDIFKE